MKTPNLSAEQSRLVVEHSPSLIWRSDAHGSVDFVNDALLEFTGRPLARELCGDGLWSTLDGGVDDQDRTLLQQHLERREAFDLVVRMRRYDGLYRYVSMHVAPFTNDDGSFGGFVATCVDIDERRRADEQKTAFLEMLAHELRTPLTPMHGYIQHLERRISRGEPVFIEMVQKLARQLDRVEALVEHLSDAARINAGKEIGIAMGEVDLTEVVRELVSRHGHTNEITRRTELVLEAPDGERIVNADATRIRQLFRHIITNAIKFSPRGGTIKVQVESSPFEHVISVRDMGIGIPDSDLEDVTRAYYRAKNASPENYPGIGLGLAIAREIAEAHGGSLRVQSALGQGTEVTVRLPAARAEA
ncbi:MAG: PAS domain-containing sensor histidine kinase [Polyangiaceae bacterium]|nr:PAS domain-containing sensor histidine kinase [Polyangiaceae bacterium]